MRTDVLGVADETNSLGISVGVSCVDMLYINLFRFFRASLKCSCLARYALNSLRKSDNSKVLISNSYVILQRVVREVLVRSIR